MIRLKDVEMEYPNGTRAIRGISAAIEDGEFVFLVGPSGSGKSTIIKMLTGEEVPTAGRIMINGFSVSNIAERQVPMMRRTLGVIFQDFRLIEKKTVYENLEFVMRAVGMPKKEIKQRITYVLQLVGLEKKAENYPQRAFRRRAAAGGHRPGAGEQPCYHHCRRAYRQSGPGALHGDHDAAGEDQPAGHHRGGSDPRKGSGKQIRQAGHYH